MSLSPVPTVPHVLAHQVDSACAGGSALVIVPPDTREATLLVHQLESGTHTTAVCHLGPAALRELAGVLVDAAGVIDAALP